MIPPSFDFTVPEDWAAVPPTPGCAAIVAEPETDADSFRCSVSLVFEEIVDDLDLEQYTRTRVDALADLLTDALLIDERPTLLAGAEAIVSTVGYRQGTDARTLRQWSAIADGVGVLVGAVCSNDRFPGLQPTLDEIAESLVLGSSQ